MSEHGNIPEDIVKIKEEIFIALESDFVKLTPAFREQVSKSGFLFIDSPKDNKLNLIFAGTNNDN